MKLKSKFQIGVCSTVALAMCDVLAAKEPLYEGLGSYSRKITTDSPEAQRYFDQGLAFLHGFNHRAAIRAFQQAAEIDPRCAMAHWSVALACGPHQSRRCLAARGGTSLERTESRQKKCGLCVTG